MKYIKPELKINMFAQEEIFTRPSSSAGEGTVPGLENVKAANIKRFKRDSASRI